MLEPGTRVGSRFVVERYVATGGMGAVYCALDAASGERVALKLLDPRSALDFERFDREARALASIESERVVRYVGHGVREARPGQGEQPWLAMAWLEGEDLQARLRREALSFPDALRVALRAAEALAALHRRGFVHRDLKPANLFLVGGELDSLTLIDLGIARAAGAAKLTETGVAVGTPGYMAPEQARGLRGVDARADVYALGCVLFECLSGKPPFVAEHPMALLAKIVLEAPPRLSSRLEGVSPALEALMADLLAKAPERRPADGAALAARLASLSAEGEIARAGPRLVEHITTDERRIVSVVSLAVAPPVGVPGSVDGPTLLDPFARGEDAQGDAGPPGDELSRLAARHEARLEHLVDGTRLLVLAGHEEATDLAEAGLRIALELARAYPEARVALATGRARIGADAPTGEVLERIAVNLGAAFRGELRPGAVWIDELSRRLVRTPYPMRAEGSVFVVEPVQTATHPLASTTALVGRRRELGLLAGALEESRESEVPGVVLVIGAPGIGKTRLLSAFAEQAAAELGSRAVSWASADPVRARAPLGLVADFVARQAGLRDDDDGETRRRRLGAALDEVMTEGPGRDRALDFLGDLVGARVSGAVLAARRQPAQLLELRRAALAALLAAGAERFGAQVVLLEDLHWADAASLELLGGALDRVATSPILVVGSSRPALTDPVKRLAARDGGSRLEMEPLSPQLAKRLLTALANEPLTDTDAQRRVALGGGNPLFLAELARADAVEGRVPASVSALVEARLAALPPFSRRLLRAASVFGADFPLAGAEALLGEDPSATDVGEELRRLRRRGVLGRAKDRERARFAHELWRAAAYSSLTEEDRARGHRLAGRFLESRGLESARVRAHHHELGGDRGAAAAASTIAAEEAIRAGALDDALSCAARAEAAGGRDRGRLLRVRAEVALWRGELTSAASDARAALEEAEVGSQAWAESAVVLCQSAGRGEGAADEIEALVVAAGGRGADREAAAVLVAGARELYRIGRYEAAERTFRALPSAEAAEPALAAELVSLAAFRELYLGSRARLRDLQREAHRRYDELGYRHQACAARGEAGFASALLGDLDAAERELSEALEEAKSLGVPHVEGWLLSNLGPVLLELGRVREARSAQRAALERLSEQDDPRLEGCARAHYARMLLAGGDLEAAAAEAEAGARMLEPFEPLRGLGLAVLAEIALARGDAQVALQHAREGAALAERLGQLEEGEGLVFDVLWRATLAAGTAEEAEEARRRGAARREALSRGAP